MDGRRMSIGAKEKCDDQWEGAVNVFTFATVSINSANCRHRKRIGRKNLVITGVNLADLQD
jgi:hypothetical protein